MDEAQIVDVWSDNLEEAFCRIRDVLELYPYVSIDTEFPGIVAKPTSYLVDYNYQTIKCNVDLLKIIQLGLSFANAEGQAPPTSTWQFNFKFDLEHDMYAQDSIDLLKGSGIDFDMHQRRGIDLAHFGELIMSSGLVMNEDVIWISFHGCYDFAYLLKLLTCTSLPTQQKEFFELLRDFFPSLYDIKFLLEERSTRLSSRSSLQKIAEHLEVTRVGPQHQAGSDSLVTSRTFFKLMRKYFENKLDDQKYQGVIYGLGVARGSTAPGEPKEAYSPTFGSYGGSVTASPALGASPMPSGVRYGANAQNVGKAGTAGTAGSIMPGSVAGNKTAGISTGNKTAGISTVNVAATAGTGLGLTNGFGRVIAGGVVPPSQKLQSLPFNGVIESSVGFYDKGFGKVKEHVVGGGLNPG